jgi:predicted nuclease of predicted toxin-antitoxin system
VRFKLDENMPESAGDLVRAAGHEATTVHQEGLAGAADEVITNICKTEDMILLTLHLAFGSILSYPPSSHPGIVVVRVAQASAPKVKAVVTGLFSSTDIEQLRGAITIAEPGRVRFRR